MPAKRKRNQTTTKSKKRLRQDDTEEDDAEWAVIEILDENPRLGYLLRWAPHPETGEEYPPDWQPKQNVGVGLIQEWVKKQQQQRQQKDTPARLNSQSQNGSNKSTPRVGTPAATTRRPIKRTIDSSPSTASRTSRRDTSPAAVATSQPDRPASSLASTPGAFTGTRSRTSIIVSPQIEISPLGSSQRNKYDSDFASSQVISGTAPERLRSPSASVLYSSQTFLSHRGDASGPGSTSRSVQTSQTGKRAKRQSEVPDSQSHNTTLVYHSRSPRTLSTGEPSTQSNINVNTATTGPNTIVISSGTSGSNPTESIEPTVTSSQIVGPSQRYNRSASPGRQIDTVPSARPRESSIDTSRSDESVAASSPAQPQLRLSSPFRPDAADQSLPFVTQVSLTPSNGTTSETPRKGLGIRGVLDSVRKFLPFRATQSSSIESISSLPEPPTQHPDTLHSAPARPESLSEAQHTLPSIMAPGSPPSDSETSVRIQELREAGGPITPAQRSLGMTTRSAIRGASPAGLREDRSPSVVPSAEVIPMPTEEENRTSERYQTLYPELEHAARQRRPTLTAGVTEDSSLDERSNMDGDERAAEVADDEPEVHRSSEFCLPILFLAQQRDHYKNSIIWKKDFIESFLEQTWPDDSAKLDEANQLVERLQQIIAHPDLMNEETFSQASIAAEQKAQYDKSQSAKIFFVSLLLAELADQNVHVVIDVSGGRMLDILDEFLTGIGVQHTKAGGRFDDESRLRVTLLAKEEPSAGLAKANLVIGYEGATELIEDERKELRTLSETSIAPLVYLVVPRSVEHIQRCMRADTYSTLPLVTRLLILIENIARLRVEAGHVHGQANQDQQRKNAAALLAQFIIDGHRPDEWPLDELSELNIINAFSESQATTESEPHASLLNKATKRPHEDETNSNGLDSKKARIEADAAQDMPSTIDPSSLSLSLGDGTMQMVADSEFVSDLAVIQHDHHAREIETLKQMAALEIRLQEHVQALEDLQYRHEEQRRELVKTRAERESAYESASNAMNLVSSRETLLSKVKGDRDGYKTRLAAAEAALASHTIPEIAEFEALKTSVAAAEKEKTKLEQRVKNTSNDLEYIRGLYQEVTTKGSALAEERNELEARVADLEKRASEQRATALRLTGDQSQKQLHLEIKRLRATLAEREKILVKREEEITKLREKDRGRMTTRGGSVPRSPGRLGSPMRLEPPRMGSRTGSPVGKSRLGR